VVLAVNDRVAIGIIAELTRRGWRMPEMLAVVGHDNWEIASVIQPPLTTVDQNIPELMKTTSEALLGWINDQKPPERTTILPTTLVVRESHQLPQLR